MQTSSHCPTDSPTFFSLLCGERNCFVHQPVSLGSGQGLVCVKFHTTTGFSRKKDGWQHEQKRNIVDRYGEVVGQIEPSYGEVVGQIEPR